MGKAERTRQFIIETAAPIFNQKGVAGTAISDILDATRLAKGGIYGNFTSKEEMVLEVFDYIAEIEKQQLKALTAAATTAVAKFEAVFRYYARYMSNRKVPGGCPVINFGSEADDTNPALKKRVGNLAKYFLSRIEYLVMFGKETGEFREDWDEKEFAIMMFTILEGGILITSITRNNKYMLSVVEILRKEVRRHMR
ncbi:MAG TPA: TetR family transcriptional regulator [Chitinophaga sp.]|uniref:TetR/AcrR family transcriptional regulator n=1 Tax=Chitinophaga sp. TaxID=1869181 RepID=UPI002BA35279|nr:TetR family transcriptional regulator [Chitinophaga sp.]HVI44337.1 TetR family transcriptional regulator [Chitinophaga sp.]